MIFPSQAVRIVIATKPVDFRKGHDGLAAVAEHELGLDPHSGVIVVFRAKRGDRIKVLLWDGSGMVMSYKRPGTWQVRLARDQRRGDAAGVTLLRQRNWDQSIQVGRVGRTGTL